MKRKFPRVCGGVTITDITDIKEISEQNYISEIKRYLQYPEVMKMVLYEILHSYAILNNSFNPKILIEIIQLIAQNNLVGAVNYVKEVSSPVCVIIIIDKMKVFMETLHGINPTELEKRLCDPDSIEGDDFKPPFNTLSIKSGSCNLHRDEVLIEHIDELGHTLRQTLVHIPEEKCPTEALDKYIASDDRITEHLMLYIQKSIFDKGKAFWDVINSGIFGFGENLQITNAESKIEYFTERALELRKEVKKRTTFVDTVAREHKDYASKTGMHTDASSELNERTKLAFSREHENTNAKLYIKNIADYIASLGKMYPDIVVVQRSAIFHELLQQAFSLQRYGRVAGLDDVIQLIPKIFNQVDELSPAEITEKAEGIQISLMRIAGCHVNIIKYIHREPPSSE